MQVQRTQFCLVVAESMTVHKSQGSTYQQVAVHTSSKMPRSSLYVACSRATTADGLYIVGAFKPPKPPTAKDLAQVEIERLRANAFVPKFDTLLHTDVTRFTAFYHNVQSLRKHHADIVCDPIPMAADLLLMVETWTLPTDSYEFPGFELVGRIDCKDKRSGSGVFCCVSSRARHLLANVQVFQAQANHGHVEILRFEFQLVTMCIVYSSPKASPAMTVSLLQKALEGTQRDVILIGDMNVDLKKRTNSLQQSLLVSMGLQSKLPASDSTTNANSQIDWCFSNRSIIARPYETLFSYHKPLHLSWNVDGAQDNVLLRDNATNTNISSLGQQIAEIEILNQLLHEPIASQDLDQAVLNLGDFNSSVREISKDGNDQENINDDTKIVSASQHQGDARFVNPGIQCTAMAASAIAMAGQSCPSTWTRATLDCILAAGDALYTHSKHNLPAGQIYLLVAELHNEVEIAGKRMCFTRDTALANGFIWPTASEQCVDYPTAINSFLSENGCGILTASLTSVAIGKTQNGKYWLFDSHSRNRAGFKADNGKACLALSEHLEVLCEMFKHNILPKEQTDSILFCIESSPIL